MVTEEQRRSSCVGAVRPHLFMTPGATGTVFMACSFPCLPSPHNEPHYSAPLASTIAVLFWHRTHQHHRWWWWWWRDQRWAKEKTKSKVFLEFQGKTFGFCFIQILFCFFYQELLGKVQLWFGVYLSIIQKYKAALFSQCQCFGGLFRGTLQPRGRDLNLRFSYKPGPDSLTRRSYLILHIKMSQLLHVFGLF